MARIRVVTDSACDIPEEVARRLNIDIVSSASVSVTRNSPIASISHRKRFGRSARPARHFRRQRRRRPALSGRVRTAKADNCDGVIVLTLSALLSATNQSAVLARGRGRCLGRSRHRHQGRLDGAGLLVIDVAELAATAPTSTNWSRTPSHWSPRSASSRCSTRSTPHQGRTRRRCSRSARKVLSIKPLLELKDGVVAEAGRQRTRSKALVAIAEVVKSHAPLKRLALVHARRARSPPWRHWWPTSTRRTRSSSPTWVRSWARTAARGSLDCVGLRSRRPTR